MTDETAAGIHVEGDPLTPEQKVDYAVFDRSGRTVAAVQVKSRTPDRAMSGGEMLDHLLDVVCGSEADTYRLEVNAAAGVGARETQRLLSVGLPLPQLLRELEAVLSGAKARLKRLRGLPPSDAAKLQHARIMIDERPDTEIRGNLRERLRSFRNSNRAGLGDRSAGLLTGYLVDQILQRAADASVARLSTDEIRSMLLVGNEELSFALGCRDWGIPIGSIPPVPDIVRKEELRRLSAALPVTRPRGIRCTALVGLSGIGKTSLAVSFLADRADSYDMIFWVDAESPASLATSYRQIAVALGGPQVAQVSSSEDIRVLAERGLHRLSGRWLMVFDNVVDFRGTSRWIPSVGDGDVIITAVDAVARYGSSTEVIEIPPMTAGQSIELLARRLRVDTAQRSRHGGALAAMAMELGRWPLALELGSGYMASCDMGVKDIPEYLSRLRIVSLDDEIALPADYPRTIVAVVSMSIERLRQLDCMEGWTAQGVLVASTYLSFRQIPIHVAALGGVGVEDEIVEMKNSQPHGMLMTADERAIELRTALRRLRQLSLIAPDRDLPPTAGREPDSVDRTIHINSVVQDVVRLWADQLPGRDEILRKLAVVLERWLVAAADQSEFERAFILFVHTESLVWHLHRLGIQNPAVALLYGNLAHCYSLLGDYDSAIWLLRQQLAMVTTSFDDGDLAMQARLGLATSGLADPHGSMSPDEAAEHLDAVAAYAEDLAAGGHTTPASYFASIGVRLIRKARESGGHPRWDLVQARFEGILSRADDTEYTRMLKSLDEADEMLWRRELDQAEAVAVAVRAADRVWGPSIDLNISRIILTARVLRGDWDHASDEIAFLKALVGHSPMAATDIVEVLLGAVGACIPTALSQLIEGRNSHEISSVLECLTTWPTANYVGGIAGGPIAARLEVVRALLDVARGQTGDAERRLLTVEVAALDRAEGRNKDSGWPTAWRAVRMAILELSARSLVQTVNDTRSS